MKQSPTTTTSVTWAQHSVLFSSIHSRCFSFLALGASRKGIAFFRPVVVRFLFFVRLEERRGGSSSIVDFINGTTSLWLCELLGSVRRRANLMDRQVDISSLWMLNRNLTFFFIFRLKIYTYDFRERVVPIAALWRERRIKLRHLPTFFFSFYSFCVNLQTGNLKRLIRLAKRAGGLLKREPRWIHYGENFDGEESTQHRVDGLYHIVCVSETLLICPLKKKKKKKKRKKGKKMFW